MDNEQTDDEQPSPNQIAYARVAAIAGHILDMEPKAETLLAQALRSLLYHPEATEDADRELSRALRTLIEGFAMAGLAALQPEDLGLAIFGLANDRPELAVNLALAATRLALKARTVDESLFVEIAEVALQGIIGLAGVSAPADATIH